MAPGGRDHASFAYVKYWPMAQHPRFASACPYVCSASRYALSLVQHSLSKPAAGRSLQRLCERLTRSRPHRQVANDDMVGDGGNARYAPNRARGLVLLEEAAGRAAERHDPLVNFDRDVFRIHFGVPPQFGFHIAPDVLVCFHTNVSFVHAAYIGLLLHRRQQILTATEGTDNPLIYLGACANRPGQFIRSRRSGPTRFARCATPAEHADWRRRILVRCNMRSIRRILVAVKGPLGNGAARGGKGYPAGARPRFGGRPVKCRVSGCYELA